MSEAAKPDSPISLPSFSNYNKFHWMLGGEAYALRMGRDMFAKDLKQAQEAERQYCNKFHCDRMMTDSVFNAVCQLVERCSTFYEVEALARYVFDDNYIPDYEEVQSRAKALKAIVPVWDILKATPNARRSF